MRSRRPLPRYLSIALHLFVYAVFLLVHHAFGFRYTADSYMASHASAKKEATVKSPLTAKAGIRVNKRFEPTQAAALPPACAIPAVLYFPAHLADPVGSPETAFAFCGAHSLRGPPASC